MNIKEIKKIIFSILKEILEGDRIPNCNDYNISEKQYVEIIKLMTMEKYLNKDNVLFNILGQVEIDKELNTVTAKGLEFIENNEAWNDIYKGINNFKDLL